MGAVVSATNSITVILTADTPGIPFTLYTSSVNGPGTNNQTSTFISIQENVNYVTITGGSSETIITPKTYTYSITSSGTICSDFVLTGNITVNPKTAITLDTSLSTANQQICIGDTFAPITYNVNGSAGGVTVTYFVEFPNSSVVTGPFFNMPMGMALPGLTGNKININAGPATNDGSNANYVYPGLNQLTERAIFTMTMSTTSNLNSCDEDTVIFRITASPGVVIDETNINNWVIKDESCFGFNDGIIDVPSSAITGGTTNTSRIVRYSLSGTATPSDIVSVTINGINSIYNIVDTNGFINRGGTAENYTNIALGIASKINLKGLPVVVTPNFYGAGTLKIEASTPSISFTDSVSITRGIGSALNVSTTVVQENSSASYVYRWQRGATVGALADYPAGNDLLRLNNLDPGLYQLTVSVNSPGSCSTVMSNTLTVGQAPNLSVSITADCAGTYTASITNSSPFPIPSYYDSYTYRVNEQPSGGSAVQVHTFTGSALSHSFSVIPGKTYVVLVEINTNNGVALDNCTIASIPFNSFNNLTLDSTRATIGHLTCNGINEGSITISDTTLFIGGGSGGYDFAWSGPGGFSSTNQSISNLVPGNYTVVVTDRINASCNESASFIVNDRPALVVTPRTSTNSTQMFCQVISQLIPDASWGTIAVDVSLAGGGIVNNPGFIWRIQPSGLQLTTTTAGSDNELRIKQPGLYTLEFTDLDSTASSCTIIQNFNIVGNITPVEASISVTNPGIPAGLGVLTGNTLTFTNDGCSGTQIPLEINFTGGNGGYEYRIISGTNSGSWQTVSSSSGSSTTRLIEQLTAGNYSVEVRDMADCNILGVYPKPIVNTTSGTTVINSIQIVDSQTDPLLIEKGSTNITEIDCENNIDGSIEVTISGGLAPYRIQWNGPNIDKSFNLGITQTSFLLDNLNTPGNYTATVYDVSNCINPATEVFTLGDGSATALGKPVVTATIQSCGTNVLPDASINLVNSVDVEIYWETLGLITKKNKQVNNVFVSNPSVGDIFTVTISDIDYVHTAVASNTNAVLLALGNVITSSNVSTTVVTSTNQSLSKLTITGNNIGEEISISVSGAFTSNFAAINLTSIKSAIENTQGYVKIPGSDGARTIYGLQPGYYHAVVTEESSCVTWITDDIYITSGSFALTNARLDYSVTCGNSSDPVTADYSFTIEGGSNESLRIELNGQDITLANQLLNNGNRFTIRNLVEAKYTLLVSSNSSPTTLCPLNTSFEIKPTNLISINEINPSYLIDPIEIPLCDDFIDFQLEESNITGGIPFYDSSNNPYYAYQWIRPDGSRILNKSSFRATQGVYELRIQDSNGCTNDLQNPIRVEFTYPHQNLELSPGLLNSDGEGVFSLPVSCGINAQDGRISVNIQGGAPDLIIKWYELAINITNVGSPTVIEIVQWEGQQDIFNAPAGAYKMILSAIQGNNSYCSGKQIGYNYSELIVNVEDDKSLIIQDGPLISSELCSGLPGTLIIDVLDSQGSELEFRYGSMANNSSVRSKQIDDNTYEISIFEPLESAFLFILNDRGCGEISTLNLELGTPAFDYTSINNTNKGFVAANENVTFANESTQPYSKWIWYYGDGNLEELPEFRDLNDNDGDGASNYAEVTLGFDKNDPTSIPPDLDGDGVPDGLSSETEVVHQYNISGTYYVTLRIYNSLGCYDEITKPVSVGDGYYVLKPNVFTPLLDEGINDSFKLLISGFMSYTFTIYDFKGNLVYSEQAIEADPQNPTGLEINGWDAKGGFAANGSTLASYNHNGSPYYVYVIEGALVKDYTPADPKIINQTGTFILLN